MSWTVLLQNDSRCCPHSLQQHCGQTSCDAPVWTHPSARINTDKCHNNTVCQNRVHNCFPPNYYSVSWIRSLKLFQFQIFIIDPSMSNYKCLLKWSLETLECYCIEFLVTQPHYIYINHRNVIIPKLWYSVYCTLIILKMGAQRNARTGNLMFCWPWYNQQCVITPFVFSGVLVSILAIGPKVCGFKPSQGWWIFKGN
jgi:hypothetical protein